MKEKRIEVWIITKKYRWGMVDGKEVLQRLWVGRRSRERDWRTLYRFVHDPSGAQMKVPITKDSNGWAKYFRTDEASEESEDM